MKILLSKRSSFKPGAWLSRKANILKKYRGVIILLTLPILSSCSYTFYAAGCDYPVPKALHKIQTLDPLLNETSGLIVEDSVYFTFNDSGADAEIFSFTRHSSIIQKTIISNAVNVDWEAIASDEEYFYLADVGNNFGTRDTLAIYIIPAADLRNRNLITSATEKITFTYNEETSMSSTGWFSHDCEAMFSYGDSLYLISKDWVGNSARIYTLPKIAGHYNIEHRQAYEVDALITGADINEETREVALVGYRSYVPVLIVYNFETDPSKINCGGKVRKYPLRIGTQTEAVGFDKNGKVYITAEKQLYKQALYTTY